MSQKGFWQKQKYRLLLFSSTSLLVQEKNFELLLQQLKLGMSITDFCQFRQNRLGMITKLNRTNSVWLGTNFE